jgi:hypothetical protein
MHINLILFVILIAIIIFINLKESFEQFNPVSSNQYSTWEKDYKSDTDKTQPTFYSQLDYNKVPKINCCLVEKKYLPDPNDLNEGSFKYLFTKKSGSQCDSSNYNLNSNSQLLIEGDNGWSNSLCSNTAGSKQIGSCRNINKECIDFVDKKFCDKYRMKWSSKTCHQPLEFTWIDPINIDLPTKKPGDGTFKMF